MRGYEKSLDFDLNILESTLLLLSEGKPVNKHSICKRAGIGRYSLDYRIKKLFPSLNDGVVS